MLWEWKQAIMGDNEVGVDEDLICDSVKVVWDDGMDWTGYLTSQRTLIDFLLSWTNSTKI